MRFAASGLFLLAHGLLVLEYVALGTALHGIAEIFLAPWAIRHRAWDLIVHCAPKPRRFCRLSFASNQSR